MPQPVLVQTIDRAQHLAARLLQVAVVVVVDRGARHGEMLSAPAVAAHRPACRRLGPPYAAVMRPLPGTVLHFSEDPRIREFVPHVAPTSTNPEALVWAVDADRAPDYWFPRDVPARAGLGQRDDDRGGSGRDPGSGGRSRARDRVRLALAAADGPALRVRVRRRGLRAVRRRPDLARPRRPQSGTPARPARARRRPARAARGGRYRAPTAAEPVALVGRGHRQHRRVQRDPAAERPAPSGPCRRRSADCGQPLHDSPRAAVRSSTDGPPRTSIRQCCPGPISWMPVTAPVAKTMPARTG